MTEAQLKEYFARTGYAPADRGEDGELSELHLSHMLHIPWESLNPYLKRPVSLDPEDLFDKFVRQHRGGYCFEQNGFFYEVVTSMGYTVSKHIARLNIAGTGFGGNCHRVNIVTLSNGERRLIDVGCSVGFLQPLRLEFGVVQEPLGHKYRIIEDPLLGYVVEHEVNGEFTPYLAVNPYPSYDQDFEVASYFTSTNPNSMFVNHITCTLRTPEGRISLNDNIFTTVTYGERVDVEIPQEEIGKVLEERFGIKVEL